MAKHTGVAAACRDCDPLRTSARRTAFWDCLRPRCPPRTGRCRRSAYGRQAVGDSAIEITVPERSRCGGTEVRTFAARAAVGRTRLGGRRVAWKANEGQDVVALTDLRRSSSSKPDQRVATCWIGTVQVRSRRSSCAPRRGNPMTLYCARPIPLGPSAWVAQEHR
jgi:hypothetical protein